MDEGFFLLGGLLIPIFCTLLGLAMRKREDFAAVFPFVGGLIGMLTTTATNSDGSITVAYNATQTIGLWPALYFPIIFTIVAFFAFLYIVLDHW